MTPGARKRPLGKVPVTGGGGAVVTIRGTGTRARREGGRDDGDSDDEALLPRLPGWTAEPRRFETVFSTERVAVPGHRWCEAEFRNAGVQTQARIRHGTGLRAVDHAIAARNIDLVFPSHEHGVHSRPSAIASGDETLNLTIPSVP